ncbi:MAG: hypothetical protein MZV64_54345 [Ignavibacteriales bacterium]|nr:hypothetical protein [Ignavibacteriales bacterium]
MSSVRLSANFLLDGEADLGYYSIIFTKDGMSYHGSFTVEEYKKPEYKVNVTTDRNQYANGDKIAATVSADYYFGSPVKEALGSNKYLQTKLLASLVVLE